MENLVLRSDRKLFMGVKNASNVVYTRMKGFTDLSESKNAIEYSRKYVDEPMERTDVTGYSSSYGFTFDLMTPNAVLTDIAKLIDDEELGTDAVREFICVDFHKPVTGGGYEAIKRTFSVIGDSVNGDNALQYSGTLKVTGEAVKGVAKIATPESGNPDNVETITFEENTDAE